MKDFHVHERHSGDALEATVNGYLEVAEKRGIDEIGFVAHLIITGKYTRFSIQPNQIQEYFDEIEAAKASTKIKLKIGLEVDYFPKEERKLASILDEYPFDFILGSLHFPNDFNMSSKEGFTAFSAGRNIEEVLGTFYSLWKQAVESGLFDVMAHPDYFRRALHQINPSLPPFERYGATVLEAIDSLKSYGVGFEVNASGFKHGIEDCYPILGFVKAAKDVGVDTVTIGSDSHDIDQLGLGLNEAFVRLKEAGYTNISVFSGRKARKLSLAELQS